MKKIGQANIFFQLNTQHTPTLNELISKTDAATYSGNHNDFFALEESFQAFINSGELQSIVNHELYVMKNNPHYIPKGSNGNTVLIFESPKVALTATVLDERNTSSDKIFSAAGDAIFGNVGPDSIPLRFHKIPGSCDIAVFDKNQVIVPMEKFDLPVRGVVKIPSREVATEYIATKKTTLVKLSSKLYHPLIWIYDKATGVPRFSSSGDLHASRLQSTINLLNVLESEGNEPSEDSIESMIYLAGHPFHFVRWAAVQGLCKMDFGKGKHILSNAREDRHPHIARAARSSVEKLKAQGVEF